MHDWLSFRFLGLYVPEVPPKKAIGNKDSKFIEERRFQLEDFLQSLTRHTYLYKSDDFSAWVRSTSSNDLFASLKEKVRNNIKSMSVQNIDGELVDRIERYEDILVQIRTSTDYDKRAIENKELHKMIDMTSRFANVNIPWLKNMASNLKQLAEKNEKYL